MNCHSFAECYQCGEEITTVSGGRWQHTEIVDDANGFCPFAGGEIRPLSGSVHERDLTYHRFVTAWNEAHTENVGKS